MIVSHRFRCVYMAVPKTGTTSVRSALEMIGGEPFVWGDEAGEWQFDTSHLPQRSALKHICALPKELSGYSIIASVRNPYDRQISRYLEGIKNRHDPTQKHFEEYTLGSRTNFGVSCSGWLAPRHSPPAGCIRYKVDHLLKMETIGEDFNRLPFVHDSVDFPCENIRETSGNDLCFTPKMQRRLAQVWKRDFEEFNYEEEECYFVCPANKLFL